MARSSQLRRARRSDWRTTATNLSRPVERSTTLLSGCRDFGRDFGSTASEFVSRRTLSDGVVVEATIVARLLGIKLLVANARVTLTPAGPAPIAYVVDRPVGPSGLSEAVDVLAHASRTLSSAKHLSLGH